MKKIFKEIQLKGFVLIVIAGVVFPSCNDYLDETPDNRQELKNLSDVSELLVSAYSEGTYNFIEWRSDNVIANDQLPQEKWFTANFCFTPITSAEDQDTPSYLWNTTYNAIAHANQALEALERIEGGDEKKLKAIRGEALMARAYNHFILASVFCQSYDEIAAGTVLGIPYVVAPEKELQAAYDRGTLQETYDLIEKDILEGLPLVSDDYYKGTGKYHFNKGASYAFASRFFLWKGDYENCIKYSNMLLGTGEVNVNYCRDYAEVFKGSSGETMANKFIDPKFIGNLLVVRKESYAVNRFNMGYQPTAEVFKEVYENSVQGGGDKRNTPWGYRSGAVNPPKYTELFFYTTATTGRPYFIMNELRAEEVILNRIEAYVKTGRIVDALTDYNIYAPTRYENGGQLTLNDIVKFYSGTEIEAMMKFIIDERQKEFFREGMRWWDIKRYKLSIKHKDIQGNVHELKVKDLRKAVQIPAKAIANGIEANPV